MVYLDAVIELDQTAFRLAILDGRFNSRDLMLKAVDLMRETQLLRSSFKDRPFDQAFSKDSISVVPRPPTASSICLYRA